jgi:UDP-N-acetyl-D-mannosaminuronic acid dehydrogenase
MPLTLVDGNPVNWTVRRIGVIGPGIVGMPMAALLAHARIREGSDTPARVTVVQRASPTSGWKVDAINAGKSPIGGVEPDLDRVVAESVAAGLLDASHDVATLSDADVVLVCVQTDKKGFAPDYGPMFDALEGLAAALAKKPAGNIPLVVFESTLAPSSMATLMRDHFARFGLVDGKDILLGNSPNRVMPGRLVERVAASDKIVAGLHPATPRLIERLYARIVTGGILHPTSSLTAEVVKTLENAYRDVRIAYAAEVVRWCDRNDVDFFGLRDAVNRRLAQEDAASSNPTAVPTGGLLVPTVGVGGHCLPKDGILLWWRRLESGHDGHDSLILRARHVNDASPAETLALAERAFGDLSGKAVALLGVAYRFDSEDTRNSPTMALARLLLAKGCDVRLTDPYVKPGDQNLLRTDLDRFFTNDRAAALRGAHAAFVCTGHRVYADDVPGILAEGAPTLAGFADACNLCRADAVTARGVGYAGIGRGRQAPDAGLVDAVLAGFQAVERGVGREVSALCDFLNERYAATDFQKVRFSEVQRIAGTCTTGCAIADALPPPPVPAYRDFASTLVATSLL